MSADSLARATASLYGLLVGDALGSQFYVPANRPALTGRTPPPGPWQWTDDTEMACSIHHVLAAYGAVDQDALAASFATRHDFDRGYGPATGRMLRLVREGGDWRSLAAELFDGKGSWGNGAAMRVAPLGAWFAGDPARAAGQARLSAEITHTHPEAVAGAMAIAVATSLAATHPALRATPPPGPSASPAHQTAQPHAAGRPAPGPFLDEVIEHTPSGLVRDGIRRARHLLPIGDPVVAARELGNGRQVSAQDTVPFTLWAAARNLGDYATAFWTTAAAGGDIDTTCAIVGGIVGAAAPPPPEWVRLSEPPPAWAQVPPHRP